MSTCLRCGMQFPDIEGIPLHSCQPPASVEAGQPRGLRPLAPEEQDADALAADLLRKARAGRVQTPITPEGFDGVKATPREAEDMQRRIDEHNVREILSAPSSPEVLPCPFCGTTPRADLVSFGGAPFYRVGCCIAVTPRCRERANAIDAWNRRVPTPDGIVVDVTTAELAVEHLDQEADSLRDSCTVGGVWEENPDEATRTAKLDHDSMRACAANLRAALKGGGQSSGAAAPPAPERIDDAAVAAAMWKHHPRRDETMGATSIEFWSEEELRQRLSFAIAEAKRS